MNIIEQANFFYVKYFGGLCIAERIIKKAGNIDIFLCKQILWVRFLAVFCMQADGIVTIVDI